MRNLLQVFVGFLLLASTALAERETLSMDFGWRFHLGDIEMPVPQSHHETYLSTKAGNALGPASPDWDDSDWRVLSVPHDWAVEGPFDPQANVSQGYRPRGIAWYRRSFQLSEEDIGKNIELQFDGIASHCTVWINGTLAHRNFSGYSSFQIDMTPFALYGEELNTVSIRVDASVMEGWWYEGAGIYRHTWLVKRDPVHIETDGVYANPIRKENGKWTIPVEVEVFNSGELDAEIEIATTVFDVTGRSVASGKTKAAPKALEQITGKYEIPVSKPKLWSVEEPNLYTVRTQLIRSGEVVDQVETQCGFRTIRFDAKEGFFLNDEPVKIKGICNHQDHAGLGVAIPDAMWAFRLGKLKEMGANAYRCTHAAPTKEFLEECDRIGMLVMDENRHFNSTPEYIRQLRGLVRRDRNHPSVILWSVFNEEPMQAERTGYEMVRRMAAEVKSLDSTRPVTAAMSDGFFSEINVSAAVDVMGFNYSQDKYDKFHALHPELPLISSEDTSAFEMRGEYETDTERNLISSYDTQAAYWGNTHRESWKMINERPFIAGGFVWTGFDYHGEPQPHVWPSIGSVFGCLDMCGFPKTGFYIRQSQWLEGEHVLEIAPHWNWQGREGEAIEVLGISNAEELELILNGKSLGRKTVDPYELVSWSVAYEPGELLAIAYCQGREVARKTVKTTGPASQIELSSDRASLSGDGVDTLPITVAALDDTGLFVPTANQRVEFSIEGPGKIIGLGNGDINSHEPEKGRRRSLYNGLAQVIVQTDPSSSGAITVTAYSNGLIAGKFSIPVEQVEQPARVAIPESSDVK
ncbi:beta-galactosidase GalA [Pelagicoccus albus]|uniref:Glycoside hydrolase family 2 protein n=1 Tax=Pelagicoccus albus TaxID=415222 RepID=A0A7X1E9K6_9BACT|nr:beta-galactosidase GalA [Pelagicoccus albus]MBC2607519.1 glycoside hydrolase family 2 protein [Pelagicoccus albus]